MPLIVVNNATPKCKHGSSPCKLTATTASAVLGEVQAFASLFDHQPGVHIKGFGTCDIDGEKCKPETPVPWEYAAPALPLFPGPVLTALSRLRCAKAGSSCIKVVDAGQSTIQVSPADASAVAAFIVDQMLQNATGDDAEDIRNLLDINWIPFAGYFDIKNALSRFKALNDYGAPWDYKKVIKDNFGEWSPDAGGNHSYNYDVWSNVHYGYVGSAVGFRPWVLRAGADVAQCRETGQSDPPYDQHAINLGIELWERHGTSLTSEQLMNTLRGHAGSLNTRSKR